MTVLLYMLAVLLGALIFAGVIVVCGAIAVYPGESFAIAVLLIISYALGTWALGLPTVPW